MTKGYASIVLHSHLPYVLSHGRWPHGTDWLSEAAAETYLPIVRMLNELIGEGYHPKLTIGLSPVLCEQLADSSFKEEFVEYINQKLEAAAHDLNEFSRHDRENMIANARLWQGFYTLTLDHFNNIGRDILGEFRKLQESGHVEIITCGATHGYYPLLSRDESLQVQTRMAVNNYRKHFGRDPRGIWLPECAYRPRYEWRSPVAEGDSAPAYLRKGADEFLSEQGLEFFIIDSALLKGGKSVGVYIDRFDALKLIWSQFEKGYQPRLEEADKTAREVYLVSSAPEGKKPVAIFTRDPETGVLVWSGEHGYPGDGNYLDFHKKHFPGGLRYWAVTSPKSDMADKVVYNHSSAMGRIDENSDHFAQKISDALISYHEETGSAGILMAPYDAELFGHWWFEGPWFLKETLKKLCNNDQISLTFLGEDLDRRKPDRVVSIPEGSWGQGNHHYIWLNSHTAWTWKHIYECEEEMVSLAKHWLDNPACHEHDLEVILKQTARELMLLSSSDWQFLISTFAARDYAELRLTEHYEDFRRLAQIARNKIAGKNIKDGDWQFVDDCCQRDRLFADIEIEWFARVDYPA